MSQRITNKDVATALRNLADLLEIGGEPVFRVAAYRRAADTIQSWPESMVEVANRGELQSIPGVGKGLSAQITQLVQTGRLADLDAAAAKIPIGVTELLRVPDIGPKRAKVLYEGLGIDSLESLQRAVDEGLLGSLPGVGPKGAERIADGLRSMAATDTRLPLPAARNRGMALIVQARERIPELAQLELAGSIRRFRETVGDLDLVGATDDPEAVITAFTQLPVVARVEMEGENRCRVTLEDGLSADLRLVPPRQWGSLLHHFTGSMAHNVEFRELAISQGWSFSEYGFRQGETLVECADEVAVFGHLGLDYIEPPMREALGEIELAQRQALPRVVPFGGLKGDLHLHSTWSDGVNSILELASAARDRGYEYLCVTDHSQGLGVANGLTPERLLSQRAEIDAANQALGPFRVLQGVEVEVRSDGSLDLPDQVLARLDLTIASVHSGIRRGREQVTARTLAAIRHPLVDILAHPTGRILGGRGPGDVDVQAVIETAAETGTALEINGTRVDLNDVHARAAAAAGCTIELGSDAHSVTGLNDIDYAVGTSQRAWVPEAQVLNSRPLTEMLASLKRNRR
jgi:DNA polymerase (family 10)